MVENLGVVFTTAQTANAKFEDLGIGKRDRVYCAIDILNILEEPTKIRENFDSTL